MVGPRPTDPEQAGGGMSSPPGRSDAVSQGGDPEMLLRQALRAHVGGPKGSAPGAADGPRRTVGARLTTTQILLIAAIVGLVLGMGVAFAVVAR